MNTLFDNISKSPLFADITEQQFSYIFADIHYIVRKYGKGVLIAQAGDQCDSLMIIIKGAVKGEMIDFTGRSIKIEDIEAPRAIAPAFIFGNNNYFPVNVTTTSDSEIVHILRDSFITLMQRDNRILKRYLDMISNRSHFLSEKLYFHTFHSIKEKLACYIIENTKKKNAVAFAPTITQTELAGLFGVARPSLSRTISEMVNEKIIEYSPKWIKVINIEALQRIITKNNGQ